MQSHIEEIREAGGEVLAVSVEPAAKTHEALKSAGIVYPLLADPDLEIIDAYGLRHFDGGMGGGDISRPATFVIDREGRIAWRDLTDNWRVRVRPRRVLEQLARIP